MHVALESTPVSASLKNFSAVVIGFGIDLNSELQWQNWPLSTSSFFDCYYLFFRKYFRERDAALIIKDVASALQFLHSKGKTITL